MVEGLGGLRGLGFRCLGFRATTLHTSLPEFHLSSCHLTFHIVFHFDSPWLGKYP